MERRHFMQIFIDVITHLLNQKSDKMRFRRPVLAFRNSYRTGAPLAWVSLNTFYCKPLQFHNMRWLQRKRPLRLKKSLNNIDPKIILLDTVVSFDLDDALRFRVNLRDISSIV